MKNIFKKTSFLIATGILTVIISAPLSAQAVSTVETNFENFTLGSLNGQNGWSINSQTVDQSIVENTYGFEKFGTKVLRISNNVVVTAKNGLYTPNTDEAGETSAIAGGFSTGPRQNHFEASFDFLALGQYAGKNAVHITLDRGDGARTGVLEFDDTAGGGTQVWYQGYTNQFDWRYIMTIPRDQVHSFKIVVDYVDGVSNDTVKIYKNDVLIHTANTWEQYYRDSGEQNYIEPPTIDSIIFRPVQYGPGSTVGGGFLFDNVRLYSGPAHVPETQITEEDPELVIEEASAPIAITVPVTVVNPTVNLSAVQTGLVAETPVEIATTVQTAKGDVAVVIPTNTTITGQSGWNGIVNLPKVSNATITPTVTSKQTATVALVIDVGAAGTLTFDNAVSLTLPGQAGKLVGFSQDGGATFTEITTLCVANALPGGANECKMDSGSDLKILTKHFTLFASYSVATNPSTGSRVIGRVATAPKPITTTVTPTTPVVTPSTPSTPTPVVTTPPITTSYKFTTLMKVGTKNVEVKELQKLLTQKGFGTLVADGWFGAKTGVALKAFQTANKLTADGVAGPMTRAMLNK